MSWFRGSGHAGAGGINWVLLAAGLLSTGCAGAIGAGAGALFVGAGVLSFTCYDRVSVTVTDRVTGTKLCDAKVTFFEGKSGTEATSCYQAALAAGKYQMRVERPGLAPFEQPIEVSKSGNCGQTVQTMYVALDRLNGGSGPQQIAPPPPPAPAPPPAVSAPPATTPPPTTTPPPAETAPSAPPAATPPAGTAPPAAAAPPAASAPPPASAAPPAAPPAAP